MTETFADAGLFRLLQADSKVRAACGLAAVPHRPTILRRLIDLTSEAKRQISLTGTTILQTLAAQQSQSVSAVDGSISQARGPRWHQKQGHENLIPLGLRNVDQQSQWFKSGYRGWV